MAKIRITFCEESLDVIRKASAIKGVCVRSFTAEQSVSGQCQRGRISHMASIVLQLECLISFTISFHPKRKKKATWANSVHFLRCIRSHFPPNRAATQTLRALLTSTVLGGHSTNTPTQPGAL